MAKWIPVLLAGVAAAVAGCQQTDPVSVYQANVVSFGGACEKTYENEGGTGPVSGQGMRQEWEEIQAEDAQISGGLTIGPCRTKWDAGHIEAEAIGRKAVVLRQTGDSVKFQPATANADSIVIRYSVPDTDAGGGADYTLSLYRNNVRVTKLTLTSKYSWNYRGQLLNDNMSDVPGPQPHTFFDEVRFIDPHPQDGASWELRRDGDDTAAFYVIDLADFEKVPPLAPMPDGFTNVETLGIHPDDGIDHANDLEAALGKLGDGTSFDVGPKLYFPPGKYIFENFDRLGDPGDGLGMNVGLDCHNCSIAGAGMWYTQFVGRKAMFFCEGQTSQSPNYTCHFSDFSLTGTSTRRNEPGDGAQKGFAGPMGQNSTITRVWVEHTVAGIWIGGDPPDQAGATQNLTISDCRVRDTYADGINLCNGTSSSTIRDVHIRNTGDDGIALWSVQWTRWVRDQDVANPGFISDRGRPIAGPDGSILQNGDQGQESGNLIENVSVQMPWRADCFAVYGGAGHTFQNLTCEDVLTYPGILVDNEFSSYAFGPAVTTFRNITLKRAGGEMFYEDTFFPWVHGALKFYKKEGDVANILVDGVNIISPTYSGIEFRGFGDQFVQNGEKYSEQLLASANVAAFRNITLQNVTVSNPGTESIDILQNGPLGSVNLGPGINLQAPYILDPEPIPQGWPGFFQGTSYPWTSLTSNPVLDWQQAFCDRLSAHVSACSPDDAATCGLDATSNCAAYAALYNAPFMNAVASCGTATDCSSSPLTSTCVRQALAAAPLSPAQTGLAGDYCGRCAADGGQTTDACVADFWNDETGPGESAFGASDALVARIDSVCVGGGTCRDFAACAAHVLDAAEPVNAATCVTRRDLLPPPRKVIIFGDSLSDQQNQWSFNLSGQTPSPAKGYWNGRFTNGFNWVDYATSDNPVLGARIINKAVGGGFATSMAQSRVTAPFGLRPTLDEEINGLVNSGENPSPNDWHGALVVIWAGSNDVNEIANLQPTDISAPVLGNEVVRQVENALEKLYGLGARHFVVANLAPLDRVPTARQPDPAGGGYDNDPAKINFAGMAVAQINAGLQRVVPKYDNFESRATLVQMSEFLRPILDGERGRQSVNMYQVNYACRNQSAVGGVFPEGYVDAPCPGYLFFDNLHPTTLAHCALAQLMEGGMQRVGFEVEVGGFGEFESFCPRQEQNAPWTSKGYNVPRPVRYYKESVPLATAEWVTPEDECPRVCGRSGLWIPASSQPNNESQTPRWFDLPNIPGGDAHAGTDGVSIPPGWVQPATNPGTMEAAGACLCVPNE